MSIATEPTTEIAVQTAYAVLIGIRSRERDRRIVEPSPKKT
jgi:hypothetical protein